MRTNRCDRPRSWSRKTSDAQPEITELLRVQLPKLPDSTMTSLKHKIESLRPAMDRPSPWSIPECLCCLEPDGRGGEVETTTVFLTGAECQFRCTMCDLWKYTSLVNTPAGAIPFQLSQVLNAENSTKRRWLKLYNASNFFDSRSVPQEDLCAIAEYCKSFERVIVENHPRLCDNRMKEFAQAIGGQLEVAMGLETVHPKAMTALNKGMSLGNFDRAVECCFGFGIDVRVFVLLHPPGIAISESIEWTWKTVAYALERNVRHVSIIPVRAGNGWVDRLIHSGEYQLPTAAMVRRLFEGLKTCDWNIPTSSVVEFDLWNWDNLNGGCTVCRPILKEHIAQCNRTQVLRPFSEIKIDCECSL